MYANHFHYFPPHACSSLPIIMLSLFGLYNLIVKCLFVITTRIMFFLVCFFFEFFVLNYYYFFIFESDEIINKF
jgi:hypothetical protein